MSSYWPPALASLDDALTIPWESVDRLRAAESVDIAETLEQLRRAADSAEDVRGWVAAELPDACWQSRAELEGLLAEIEKRLEARVIQEMRLRLLALATELEGGSIVHRRALRVERLNQLREQAVEEVRLLAGAEAAPPTLPGPEAEQWIEWACGLQDPEDREVLQALRAGFAQLDDFVSYLELDMWRAKSVPKASNQNGEELDVLIEEVGKSLCDRLLALASELERGRIVHNRASRMEQLNQLKEEAINELRSQAARAPQALPGPEADQWIEWACGLREPDDAEALQILRNGFVHLDDFVANLEPDMWIAGGSPNLKVVPAAERSVDHAHREQSPRQTTGVEMPVVSAASTAMGLNAEQVSTGGDEPLASHALDGPSLSVLVPRRITPNYVATPRNGDQVEPAEEQMRVRPSGIKGFVTDRIRHFRHSTGLSRG